jgi:uncharacterized phage-associated protein
MQNTYRNIKFPYNKEKATNAVLWLLHRNNGSLDKLQLVKLLFFADREHLARYGRPIIGGDYFAMDYGPVCSQLLDDLNKAQVLPFEIQQGHEVIAKKHPDSEWLSKSDLDILDEIYLKYGHIDKWVLRDMTHELKAYKKNKPIQGGNNPLPYEDFFEDMDENSKKMLKIIYDEQEAWSDFI